MHKIGKMLRKLCTVVGAVILVIGVLSLAVGWYNRDHIYIEPNSALMIDFSANISELPQENLLDEFNNQTQIRLQNLIQAIEMAAIDSHINILVARLDTSNLEMAQIQDVARVIELFRSSGKKAYVFSQGFGALGQGNREYYLATFFDKIYMQPHTYIGLTGLSIEIPFVRSVLNKLGVYPEFYTRYEYKTAMQMFTNNDISPAYRQEMNRLAESLLNELTDGIAQNRRLTDIDKLIDQAPFSAEDGLAKNLIDGIMYLPQLEQQLRDEGIENFVDIEDYMNVIHPNSGNLPTIAILTLSGTIDSGESAEGDLAGEASIGSKSVWKDLSEISEIDNLKALIVRIDSPGGDYNAADEIYFALKQLKENKKIPIIVSQSGYAASGGYFISLAGDYILAEPTTITGSIGVLGGKFVLKDLWQKLGVHWVNIQKGQNADILSANQPFTPAEQKIFNASLDEIYADFTQKVIENRPLKKDINDIARGRVWTGREAVELGLIDELGNLDDALRQARQQSKISKGEKFAIVNYPRPKSLSEKISDLLFKDMISVNKIAASSGVDIRYLNLFKRLQYDTVLLPFEIKM